MYVMWIGRQENAIWQQTRERDFDYFLRNAFKEKCYIDKPGGNWAINDDIVEIHLKKYMKIGSIEWDAVRTAAKTI